MLVYRFDGTRFHNHPFGAAGKPNGAAEKRKYTIKPLDMYNKVMFTKEAFYKS